MKYLTFHLEQGEYIRFVKWSCLCRRNSTFRVLFGSDSNFRLFCDGTEILCGNEVANPIIPDEFSADLTLKKGKHDFALGLSGKAGNAWGFCCRFVDLKDAEDNPLVIVQIEHIDAVKNLDKILTVPGIGSICIGPCDLSASMGVLNRMDDPDLNKVLDEICAKTKAAGKMLGTAAGGFPRWKARGVNWFAGASDWGAMAAGFRAFIKECRQI